jgi:hypothetical protein
MSSVGVSQGREFNYYSYQVDVTIALSWPGGPLTAP